MFSWTVFAATRRGRRRGACLLAAVTLCVPYPAGASARDVTRCMMSGSSDSISDSIKALRIVNAGPTNPFWLRLEDDPGEELVAAGDGSYFAAGFSVVTSTGMDTLEIITRVNFAPRGRVVVTHPLSNASRLVDRDVATARAVDFANSWKNASRYFFETGQTYYAIAWGRGAAYTAYVESSSSDFTCSEIPIAGDILFYDHTDFDGGANANITQGGQVYAAGAGTGSVGKQFKVVAPDTHFAGMALWETWVATTGTRMQVNLPHFTYGYAESGYLPIADSEGDYGFRVSYQGALPRIIVAGVRYHLLEP